MYLPSPLQLKSELPLQQEQASFIEKSRQTAQEILNKRDKRIALIVGPCSIHDLKAAHEYALHFKQLSEIVKSTSFMVMRVYGEKPRTTKGWKGFIYDPYLDGSYDVAQGLYMTRKLLLQLADLEIPTAMEFVDPLAASFFEDVITWGFIGARTAASQPHRQLASFLPMPIGFKNGTDGNLDDAIHGVITASSPHIFLNIDQNGRLYRCSSEGNPFTHIVLRGSNHLPNYDVYCVKDAILKLEELKLFPSLLIDCAHGNCQKDHENQKIAFESVIDQLQKGNDHIRGMMLESHLKEGNQSLKGNLSALEYAVSITDPCIDWDTTKELITYAHSVLSSSLVY